MELTKKYVKIYVRYTNSMSIEREPSTKLIFVPFKPLPETIRILGVTPEDRGISLL
jgi:hypothetical protein